MKTHLRRGLGVIVAALLSSSAMAADVKSIAILTPEQGTDFGWNQQGIDAAKAAGAKAGVKVVVAQNLGYGDVRPTLRELAEGGANLLIAHASGYNTAAPEIGAEMHVPVAIVDRPDAKKPGEIADYTLSGHEGAYLAGRLAAKMSHTGTVGIVVSGEPPSWNSQSAAFAEGVKAENPKVTVRYAVIGPAAYSDAAGGKRVTDARDRGGRRRHLRPGQRLELRHDPVGRDLQGHRRRQGLFHRRDRRQVEHRQGRPAELGHLGHDAGLYGDDPGPEGRQVRHLRIFDQARRQFGPPAQDQATSPTRSGASSRPFAATSSAARSRSSRISMLPPCMRW